MLNNQMDQTEVTNKANKNKSESTHKIDCKIILTLLF